MSLFGILMLTIGAVLSTYVIFMLGAWFGYYQTRRETSREARIAKEIEAIILRQKEPVDADDYEAEPEVANPLP